MSMRIGLSYDLRLAVDGGDRADYFQAALDQIAWADGVGIAGVTLLEHHGTADGYLPSPAVFGGAVATRTERIALSMMLIAPFHDPLRMAEDLAVLDILSRGRLSVTVAGGYTPLEFEMFGRSLGDRPAAVAEMVTVLKQAWSGEPFDYRGRTVRVTPRPYRQPRPRILIGGNSTGAARRAARLADGYAAGNPSYDEYRAALRELGKPDPGPLRVVEGPRVVYVARDPEAAWEEVGPYFLHDMNDYAAMAQSAGVENGYVTTPDVATLRAGGQYDVLTPDEFLRLGEARGGMALTPLCGGMPADLAWESLRLIESDVLPRI